MSRQATPAPRGIRFPISEHEALEALTDVMRGDLRCAENTVNLDDDKLKLVGWGERNPPPRSTGPDGPPDLACEGCYERDRKLD